MTRRSSTGAIPSVYDELAEGYDSRAGARADRLAALLRREGLLPSAARVLDLGVGTGLFWRHVQSAERSRPVVGVDLSAAMLEQARARNNPHLQLVLGDFSQLPFAASSFDRVLMAFAARHARDLTGVLNAAATVLSSDGQLLMVDYSGGTQLELSGAVMRCYALLEEIGGVVDSDVASSAFFAPCGEQELLLHATQAGFTIGPVRHVTIVEAEGPAAVAAFVMNSPPIAFDLVRCSVEQRRQVFTSLVSAGHRILPKRIASDIVVCASRPPRKR